MRKGKRKKVIKSKRWGSEWTREEQRRKGGTPGPRRVGEKNIFPRFRGDNKFVEQQVSKWIDRRVTQAVHRSKSSRNLSRDVWQCCDQAAAAATAAVRQSHYWPVLDYLLSEKPSLSPDPHLRHCHQRFSPSEHSIYKNITIYFSKAYTIDHSAYLFIYLYVLDWKLPMTTIALWRICVISKITLS